MNKTKPTLAQQTYEKVCALETMLKAHLDNKKSVPDQRSLMSERPLYLATAGPEMPLSVIRLEDAPDYLPCFDEADLLYGIPGLPILMSYCPEQIMDIGEESYLVGPMVFFRIDHIGNTVSLQVADLYQLAEFLEEHSVILMQGGESFIATSAVFFAAGTWFGFFIVALMQAGKEDDPHAGRCGEQNDQLCHQHHQADGPDDPGGGP